MAKLILDVRVKGAKKAKEEIDDVVKAGEAAEEAIDNIGSSDGFSRLVEKAELASKATQETLSKTLKLSKSLKNLDGTGFKKSVVEAKSLLHIERQLNDEIEKQARLSAKIAEKQGGTTEQNALLRKLSVLKQQTSELDKQANKDKYLADAIAKAAKEAEKIQREADKAKAERAKRLANEIAAAEKEKAREIREEQKKVAALEKQRLKEIKKAAQLERQREKAKLAYGKKVARELERAARVAHKKRLQEIRERHKEEMRVLKEKEAKTKALSSLLGGNKLGKFLKVGGLVGGLAFTVFGVVSAVQTLTTSFIQLGARVAESFFTINTQMERLQVLLNTATGGESAGAAAFQSILKISGEAPFSIAQLTDSFVKLKTAGLEPLDGTLQVVYDSIAAFGGADENLKLATIAIQQMVGKGVISMEELRRQFGEQVPTAMRSMAQGLGVSLLELTDIIKTGTLSAKEGMDAMFKVLAQKHGGSAAKLMDTMVGSVALLRNAWIGLMTDLGKSQGVFSNLKDLIRNVAETIDIFRKSTAGKAAMSELAAEVNKLIAYIKDNPQAIMQFFSMFKTGAIIAIKVIRALGLMIVKVLRTLDKMQSGKYNPTNLLDYTNVAGILKDVGESMSGIGKKSQTEFGMLADELETSFEQLGRLQKEAKKGVEIKINVSDTEKLKQASKVLAEDGVAALTRAADQAEEKIMQLTDAVSELESELKAARDSMLEEEFQLSLKLKTPEEAKKAILDEAKRYESLAANIKVTNIDEWKEQLALMKKARSLYSSMSTDSAKVSRDEVKAARQKYEYMFRIYRGGLTDRSGEVQKALQEWKRLAALQKEGKADPEKEKQAIREKLDLLEKNRKKMEEISEKYKDSLRSETEAFQSKIDALQNYEFLVEKGYDKESALAQTAYDDWAKKHNARVDGLNEEIALVTKLSKAMSYGSSTAGNYTVDIPKTDGARALGGPVERGKTYWVGEAGRELFTPDQNGFIIPNHQTPKQGSSNSVNLNVSINNSAPIELNGTQDNVNRFIKTMKDMERYSA